MSEQNKKKKLSLNRLFQNNRFVFVFSLFTAIILWFIMAAINTESRARIIDGIDISVQLSDKMVQQGYKVYSQSDTQARVSVTGDNITVNRLASDDISVAAKTSSVKSAGDYTLLLVATPYDTTANYTVDDLSPASVDVFVDKEATKTLEVQKDLIYSGAEGYYLSDPELQENEITVTGPETEVTKIDSVKVSYTFDTPLSETVDVTADYQFLDEEGLVLENLEYLDLSSDKASIHIDVYQKFDLPLKAVLANCPDGLDLSAITSVSPETIPVGSTGEGDIPSEISLKELDMSAVTADDAGKTYSKQVEIDMPENLYNIRGVKKAVVRLNLSNYTTKTFTVKKLKLDKKLSNADISIETTEMEVEVMGTKDSLKSLTSSDIQAVVDTSNLEGDTGFVSVPVSFELDASFGCWVIGQYEAAVSIS